MRISYSFQGQPASQSLAGGGNDLLAGDQLDLADIQYASSTLSYSANQDGAGGTLTASDGTHTANIVIVGQHTGADFGLAADGGLGTLITGVSH